LDKSRFLIKPFGKNPLLVILASVLLLVTALSEVAPSQAGKSDKQKIVRQVAQNWIRVGMEQYQRGFYRAAEQSFLRARDYREYLTAAEREKLSGLLEKTHIAALERKRVLEHIRTANELVEQDELTKAKAHLTRVQDSEFLTEEERALITEGLKKIEEQLGERKKEITGLYDRSVEFYLAGQLEDARGGFLKVAESGLLVGLEGKTAEDYLVKIDGMLLQRVKPSPLVEAKPPVEEVPEPAVVAVEEEKPVVVAVAKPKVVEPVADEGGYIEVINRKRNILRGRARAVVEDASEKAQGCLSEGEFDKAREAVETAKRVVNRDCFHLGEELFKQYSSRLKQLSEEIASGENERALQLEEQKRAEAIEAQRQYREQMEVDRSKRVTELMDNARAYMKQQRYEEALGQLESLLALEPLNDRALLLKQTLEDTINFRKQLEVQKESGKERVGILLKTEESMIPYAKELTYPKNWREIVAKRKPEEAIGQDPADVAVYKQLDEPVDLSELTPEMSFGEAIGILKNSVEPPLKIIVLWRDLYDNADIDQTTAINMDAISGVPLGAVLRRLLDAVSGGFADLGYVVENGVITMATRESLPSELETLVYDVTDLLGRPADFYAQAGGSISASVEEAGAEGFEIEEELDRDAIAEEALERAENLRMLIQETIERDSWYDFGGEGTIMVYPTRQPKKLVVLQSREIHNKIAKLLSELRKALGEQVSIEARFLVVGENFLEDIGLDIDIHRRPEGLWELEEIEAPEIDEGYGDVIINPQTGYPYIADDQPEWVEGEEGDWANWQQFLLNPLREIIRMPVPGTGEYQWHFRPYGPYQPGYWKDSIGTYGSLPRRPTEWIPGQKLGIDQQHSLHTLTQDTEISGSLGALIQGGGYGLGLGFGGMILDTLQVDLLLRATQVHRDAKTMTAPKVSVLSGESATLRVQRVMWYPTDPEFDIEAIGELGGFTWTVDYDDASIITGTILNITPTIMADKRNVLLNIVTELRDFLGWEQHFLQGPITETGDRVSFIIRYPETEVSRVETRVSVPDGGTLLLGGQKLTAEVEIESGVPVLSKIPFIGRLFSNRSKIKDEKILLILVKPTIILQEETEREALAAMG